MIHDPMKPPGSRTRALLPAPFPAPAIASLLMLSCTHTATETGDSSGSEPIVTTSLEAELTLSEIVPTVVTIEWNVDGAESAYVEYGLDDQYGSVRHVSPDGSDRMSTMILGLKPSREYHFRAVNEYSDGPVYGEDHSLTTGATPSDLTSTTVQTFDESQLEDGFFITATMPGGPVILDHDGDFVWWYTGQGSTGCNRAYMDPDGDSIWFNQTKEAEEGFASVVHMSMDGTKLEVINTPGAHLDFVLLPDHTIAYQSYDPKDIEGTEIMGEKIMETSPDGTTTEVWSFWDHFELEPGTLEDGNNEIHANCLDYNVEDDTYTIGYFWLSTIMKIDRSTGEPLWVMGGDLGEMELTAGDRSFINQHQFYETETGLVVFDNGPQEESLSRAVHYTMDLDSDEYAEDWAYSAGLFVPVLGSVDPLPNGNILISWGFSGQMDEISPDLELLWQLNTDLGNTMGYAQYLSSLYPEE